MLLRWGSAGGNIPGMEVTRKPTRVVRERLVRRDADDGSFDRQFWRDAGAEARFSAAWEMVQEVRRFRGENVSESRLQRSVQHIQRRTR